MAFETYHSQYEFIDGFAKHVRDALKALLIGFTQGHRADLSRGAAGED
jgi:hypothetical protein